MKIYKIDTSVAQRQEEAARIGLVMIIGIVGTGIVGSVVYLKIARPRIRAKKEKEEMPERQKRLTDTVTSLDEIFGGKIPLHEISKRFPAEFDMLYADLMNCLKTGQIQGRIDSKGTGDRKDDLLILGPSVPLSEEVAAEPVSSEQNIYCVGCSAPIPIFIPPGVLEGKEQFQTVKTCPKCGKKTSIAVLKAPDGSLNWQIGEAM